MSETRPPVAPIKPQTLTIHGHSRTDDYFWLREKSNPEVIAYIEAENAYTEAVMAGTQDLQETLYREMVGRIQETDTEAPVRRGGFDYYSRTEEGKQYPIHCRRRAEPEGPEEVLVDLNEIGEGKDYLRLGVFRPSPDNRILAYSLDEDGSENYTIYFKDLQTSELLPDRVTGTSYSGEWANDNQTYFYTTKNAAWRDYRLYRHTLGSDPASDPLIFEEPDELFDVYLRKSRDQKYLLLICESITSTEYRYLPADGPAGTLTIVQPREKCHEYGLDHRDGRFYIWTNKDARNFKIVTAPVDTPGIDSWEIHTPHDPAVKIDGLACFEDYTVIYQRRNGLKTLTIKEEAGGESHEIAFPDAAYTYFRGENPDFHSDRIRLTYTSPNTPDSVIDYGMCDRSWTLVKQKPVLGGFSKDDYLVERVAAEAPDGEKIPISLVYRKDFVRDGSAPCLLYGYGSYGYSMEPAFNMNTLSLLDRGFVYAVAHIRGGQEMGREWYDSGKFLVKKNTFTDFIACGRHLVAEKYTSAEKMAIEGRSAGGLLVGAVLNMAPDLCRAAIAGVPFVDVVTTMLDESIPLTVGEFEEWGNPKNLEYYEYMLSYSPYDNLAAVEYPHILATSGLNDPRVQFWEPTKWVAKLRTLKMGDSRLLLKTNMGAGHAGASGRYEKLQEKAFEYAFILDSLAQER